MQSESLPIVPESEISKAKCSKIKEWIDAYLSKNPRMSLQNIELKTGLPMSSLRRIVNLSGNPNPENVIKLCLALGYDKELVKYMEIFHPEISEIISMKNSHNCEYDFVNDTDAKYFLDESNFLILSLAYTTNGTTSEQIRFELGERGIEKLNELLASDIVKVDSNGKVIGNVDKFKLPLSDVKKRIEFAIKYYRPEDGSDANNWISYQTESLNDKGLLELRLLNQKQFNERKDKIFNNPEFLGNKQIYSFSVSSTFLKYNELEVLQ